MKLTKEFKHVYFHDEHGGIGCAELSWSENCVYFKGKLLEGFKTIEHFFDNYNLYPTIIDCYYRTDKFSKIDHTGTFKGEDMISALTKEICQRFIGKKVVISKNTISTHMVSKRGEICEELFEIAIIQGFNTVELKALVEVASHKNEAFIGERYWIDVRDLEII